MNYSKINTVIFNNETLGSLPPKSELFSESSGPYNKISNLNQTIIKKYIKASLFVHVCLPRKPENINCKTPRSIEFSKISIYEINI